MHSWSIVLRRLKPRAKLPFFSGRINEEQSYLQGLWKQEMCTVILKTM
jgi:hypothetical protein